GNSYRLSNKTYPPSYYYNGRFSNGPLWPEYIQELTQWKVLNYAYGGATVNNKVIQGYSGFDMDILIPSIADQIEMHRKFITSNANDLLAGSIMYIIMASGNDYTFGGPTTTPESVATNIYETSKVLSDPPFLGENFLYANIALDHLAYNMNVNATIMKQAHNGRLKHNQVLNKLIRYGTQVNAKIFDMNGFLEKQLASSNYVEASISCIRDFISRNVVPEICENPQEKVFWDLLHLSTTAHRRLADTIIKAISG
ncbi:hypothetical protein K7432_010290, partial [Basidiobolus ranarum]